MSRSVEEWFGATPNTAVPPRVRLRVFDRDGGKCTCGCGRRITAADKWETDHIIAIINGGENREKNLCTLLKPCHDLKTGKDVAEKSVIYSIRKKYLGIKKKSRFPGSRDSPFKRKVNGTVVRREK